MLRFSTFGMIGFALLLIACTKSKDNNNETALYGVWVNTHAPNDTLWFMNKGSKNILRYNNSFNSAMPVYTELVYSFKDGKLAAAVFGPFSEMRMIDSFTWKQENKSFDILIYQLYSFISSSATHGIYTKIQ